MMASVARSCLFLLLLLPCIAGAANLTYSISGVDGELEKNVLAYLGPAPDTAQDRLNFVASARSQIKNGLKALGYYQPDITIEVQRTDPVWTLAVTIVPGEPVRIDSASIQILGAAADDQTFTQLVNDSGILAGDTLHHGKFETFKQRLLTLGQQRGYLDGSLVKATAAVHVGAGTATVTIVYDSGQRFRFGEVQHDDTYIEDSLFNSLLTFKPGEYFDLLRLREFQSQLQATNYFASVVVQPERDKASGDLIPITVTLVPAKRHSFDVGVGYSTDTEERFSLTWRTPRINKYGHSQVTRLELSPVNPGGRFTYTIPISNPLTDIAQFWARLEKNEYGDLDSLQGAVGARREIKQGDWVYGYQLRSLKESWDLLNTSSEKHYILPGASISSRDYSGSLTDPSGGFNQLYTLEGAAEHAGSDIDLLRLTIEYRYIFTPWPRHRVVTRTELGAVEINGGERSDLAPSLRFFAGGNQSIRGYAYQSLGPEVKVTQADGRTRTLVVGGDRLLVGSLEYQYYFRPKWRGALFVDGGNAFDDGDFDGKVGAGFGVHYISPIGAIRVEIANSVSEPDKDWYLHLNIGAEF